MAVKCILTGQTPSVLDGVTENVQTQLNDKVDKVTGKGLSTNDYTDAEKTKLSGIETGAQKNTITGVKGSAETTYRTGNVNITATNIGLGNVDNTSDANKPISTATQTALDGKQATITVNGILKGDGSGNISAAVKGTDYDTEIGIVHYEDSFDSVEAAYNKSKRLFCSEFSANQISPTDSAKLYALLSRSQPYITDGRVEITYTFTCLDKTITLTRTKQNSTATPVDTWAKGSQSFNPRFHASTHKIGGGDTIAPSDIGAQTKITANGVLKGDGSGKISAATAADIPGLSGKQANITGAATTITDNNLTANRALISNSSGKVEVSAVTSTELGYLDGVTSNIQTQLNNKLSSAPVTSVNNKTGAVSLAKGDVGLSNVDNTSDANKPISNATQAALNDKQSKITANGILKGDGSGNITAANETEVELVSLPNICNPNLLDNWYFGNPVNQRGQTSYTGVGYTIDRWKSLNHPLSIQTGSIKVTCNSGASLNYALQQLLEDAIIGEQYTISALILENTTTSGIAFRAGQYTTPVLLGTGLFAATFTANSTMKTQGVGIQFCNRTVDNGKYFVVKAIKLELGSQQTLAHKEDGAWVLNEIPDYGEQLRRCQRYYFKTASAQNSAYMMRKADDNYLFDSCIFPVTMRTTPSIQLELYRNPTTGDVITATGAASQITPDGFCVVSDAGKFTGSSVFQVAFSATADL